MRINNKCNERHHPRRRQWNQTLSYYTYTSHFKTIIACLRQSNDLMTAFDFRAGKDEGYFENYNFYFYTIEALFFEVKLR